MSLRNIILFGSAFAGICFRHRIKDMFYECIVDNITSLMCPEIKIINTKNPRNAYAVKNELTNKLGQKYCSVATDGIIDPEFVMAYGRYFIEESLGYIYVIYREDVTILRLIPYISVYKTYTSDELYLEFKKYITKLYKNYCSSCKMIIFFTSNGDKWSFPIIREPRNFQNFTLTKEMTDLISDIDTFKSKEKLFIDNGIPFRKGYLLYGNPGTGKSTCIEIIAKKYNMAIHLLNLNSKEMSDAILINLISKVPPNSIICIEEIDKQLETWKRNNNTNISIGGILTALDGPQRLSHSSIIIITSNKRNFLSLDDEQALLREGRIDMIYEFENKLKLKT